MEIYQQIEKQINEENELTKIFNENKENEKTTTNLYQNESNESFAALQTSSNEENSNNTNQQKQIFEELKTEKNSYLKLLQEVTERETQNKETELEIAKLIKFGS